MWLCKEDAITLICDENAFAGWSLRAQRENALRAIGDEKCGHVIRFCRYAKAPSHGVSGDRPAAARKPRQPRPARGLRSPEAGSRPTFLHEPTTSKSG